MDLFFALKARSNADAFGISRAAPLTQGSGAEFTKFSQNLLALTLDEC